MAGFNFWDCAFENSWFISVHGSFQVSHLSMAMDPIMNIYPVYQKREVG